jgi:hypothetical protein
MVKQYQAPKSDSGLRFMADTREQIALSNRICTTKLCNAFRERIAMLKRKR